MDSSLGIDTTETTFGGLPASTAFQFDADGLAIVHVVSTSCEEHSDRCRSVFATWSAAWESVQGRPPDASYTHGQSHWKRWSEADGGFSRVRLLHDGESGAPVSVTVVCSRESDDE
jgi:hypothetical protein